VKKYIEEKYIFIYLIIFFFYLKIFGPVMQILKFKTVDEVIQRANDSDYGLAASVFTNDLDKAIVVSNGLRAGSVWVNTYDNFDPVAPFGGFKQSGLGREKSEFSLDSYTETKCVCILNIQKQILIINNFVFL
jgi:aldehyde dehydrogenase (NAD+)